MNDMRTERYCPADLSRDLDADIHPWLLSERDGGKGTKLSYVKVDILTDTLNRLFGPLGWGVKAEIQKMEDFQYEKPGYQGGDPSEMYVFQVISQVTLTIKPQTDTGTDTIFTQSGIGYGEVKINAHRKDAVGMAVKGAESDGLKRCCNFLGRALGMFLVGGKQDPVTYAHNGNKNQTVARNARRDRDEYEARQRERGRSGGREGHDEAGDRDGRGRDDRGSGGGRRQDAEDRGDRGQRQGGQRQNEDRQQSGDRQPDRQQGGERQRGQQGQEDRQRSDRQPDKVAGDRDQRTADDRERQDRPRQDQNGQEDGRQDADRDGPRQQEAGATKGADDAKSGRVDADKGGDDAGTGGKPASRVKNSRRANTNYDLRKAPVTREDQTDFGATFIKQIQTMRQPEDRTEQLKAYAQRINELDPDVRELVIERLKEQDMDVSMLD